MDFGFTNGDCVIIPIPSNMKPQTPIDILNYLLENPNVRQQIFKKANNQRQVTWETHPETYTSEIMGVKLVYYVQDPKTHQWELAINPTPPSSDEYNRYDTVPLIDYMGQGWKTDVEALEYLKTKKSARKLISRQAWTYMYQGAGVMYIVHPLFEVPLVLGPHDSEESILRKVTIRLDTLKRVADKYSGNV
ncbi:hypothetical protein BJ322DRAFT_1020257 [Thelephora terrestris]|uniref:Uncharacterized protein n=3 Tax=Thelephora terrestris TaxID=56493 RepID=A0A9P6L7M3_9AGAM|nr:hypothetical protein BJ322DRAFT_1020257 [Thelephora terrestris]